MAKHTVCHIEFEVADLKRSQKFFESVFAWQFRAFGDEMVVFGAGDSHVGALIKRDPPRIALCAVAWFEVEEINATLSAAVKAGGLSDGVKKPVPHVGWSGTFADPDGNPIGLVQFDRSQG